MATVEEQMRLQTHIARGVFDSLANTNWARAEGFFASVGTMSWWFEDARDADGGDVPADSHPSVTKDLKQLKDLMAHPEKGAWVSASLSLSSDGKFDLDFNYDRQVYSNLDRRPFDPPPSGEPVGPSEDSWLAEFSRYPRRRDLLPPWAPPFALIETRRLADERTWELRGQKVPPPAHLAPLTADREWESVIATAADVVQARLGRQKYPDLLNPARRERWPAILAELERQCVDETFYWGRWPELMLWQRAAPTLRMSDPCGVSRLDPLDPLEVSTPAGADVSRQVHNIVADLVRHQLVSRFPISDLPSSSVPWDGTFRVVVDRDSVTAGDDATSHRQTWTFGSETVLEDLLAILLRKPERPWVRGGATWLVELASVWGPRAIAVLSDSSDHDPARDRMLPLLTRDGELPLSTVAGAALGDPIWVRLRYVPEARALGPGDLRDLERRGSVDPPHVEPDDPADQPWRPAGPS